MPTVHVANNELWKVGTHRDQCFLSPPSSSQAVVDIDWVDVGPQHIAYSCRKRSYVITIVPSRERILAIHEGFQPLSLSRAVEQRLGTNKCTPFPITGRLNLILAGDPAVHRP